MKYGVIPYTIFNVILILVVVSFLVDRPNWIAEPDFFFILTTFLFLLSLTVLSITLPIFYYTVFRHRSIRLISILFLSMQLLFYLFLVIVSLLDGIESLQRPEIYGSLILLMIPSLFLRDVYAKLTSK